MKQVIIILASTLVLVFLFILLVNIPQLANQPSIIPLRNFYQQLYTLLVKKQPYAFTIQKTENGFYTYVLSGKFNSLNPTTKILKVTGEDGRIYLFNVSAALREDDNTWLVIYTGDLTYKQTLIEDAVLAVPPTNLTVRWNDSRPLTELEKSYIENPQIPLDIESPDSLFLTE